MTQSDRNTAECCSRLSAVAAAIANSDQATRGDWLAESEIWAEADKDLDRQL
ncbi:MAG: hypothetical protein WCJ53_16080 [Mycobacteriaceae bacterium]